MKRLDVALAGCGPGGLAAALLLHRAGHRPILFERFDTPRPLGSGLILQPTGLAVLRRLGLEAQAMKLGARIDRLFGRALPSGRTVLDVRYASLRGERHGLGIHRGTLFDLLFDAARTVGLKIETGCEIVGVEQGSGGRSSLRLAGGRSVGPFDLAVDALGSQSPLAGNAPIPLAYGALWATLDWAGGFDPHALEQRYRRASQMVGVLPIGRLPGDAKDKVAFFWSLRGRDRDAWQANGLDAWKADVRALWPETEPLLDQIGDPGQLTFARYCHRTLANPVGRGIVHLGDAWHSTSPQLGQGANMALLDAAALADSVAAAVDLDSGLANFRLRRQDHVRIYQALSRTFTPFYQSDSRLLPWLRDHLVSALSRLHPFPRLLAATVAGSLVPSGVAD